MSVSAVRIWTYLHSSVNVLFFRFLSQIHGRGLKFGIYEDYGNFTCAGYPGILGHLETDANTFASWDVDYVKLDGKFGVEQDIFGTVKKNLPQTFDSAKHPGGSTA